MTTKAHFRYRTGSLPLIGIFNVMMWLSFACAQSSGTNTADFYWIDSFAGDNAVVLNPYHDYYSFNRIQSAHGLSRPAPAVLSAAEDGNGNWGSPYAGLEISVRLHCREFVSGEPVGVMVLLRNLNRDPHETLVWNPAHENFEYVVRRGTNELATTWSEPKPPDPIPGGYLAPQRAFFHTIPAHQQAAFFVQLDRIYDLGMLGEYTVQAIRRERLSNGQGTTNILSGSATFRIVEKISPSEIEARTEFGRKVETMTREWSAATMNGMRTPQNTNNRPNQ